MARYDYVCDEKKLHESGESLIFEVCKTIMDCSTPEVCPQCGTTAKRFFGSQSLNFKLSGLGFHNTDRDYDIQLKDACNIADKAYTHKIEGTPKLSEDPQFWQELANQNFGGAKREI